MPELTTHIVWATKYRYNVLKGDIIKRCRKLLAKICKADNIIIQKGVVSSDHMHINYHTS